MKYTAHNVKMSTTVGMILTYIRRINTLSERLREEKKCLSAF